MSVFQMFRELEAACSYVACRMVSSVGPPYDPDQVPLYMRHNKLGMYLPKGVDSFFFNPDRFAIYFFVGRPFVGRADSFVTD